MQGLPRIQFRGIRKSSALTEHVESHLANLERFFGRIIDTRVVIEMTSYRHRKGGVFHVVIEANIPGRRLVVGSKPGANQDPTHEDPYVAIADAFHAMQRVLQQHARRVSRAETKERASPLAEGQVVKMFPWEGYGFIATKDGREVYFHENSVLQAGFENLEVGRNVRFAEELGELGPQASTVHA